MRRPVRCRMRWTRLRDGRVGAEAEDVHLDQAQGGDVVLVELDDHHPLGGPLERGVVGDGPVGDDEAPQVRAQVHGEGVEALDQVEEARVAALGRAGAPSRGRRRGRRPAAASRAARARRRPGTRGCGRRPRGGARCLARALISVGANPRASATIRTAERGLMVLTLATTATFSVSESLVDVVYHLVPARGTEVHVDVGHLAAVGIEEPLEQQVVADRLAGGDVERVAHDGVAGAAPAAARDAPGARPPDDVVHHQEIMGESHLLDHAELLLEKLHRSGRHRLVAAGDAPEAALGQERVGGLALGDVDLGEVEGAQVEVDVAALGDRPTWWPGDRRGRGSPVAGSVRRCASLLPAPRMMQYLLHCIYSAIQRAISVEMPSLQ